jgi:hypothetical protein
LNAHRQTKRAANLAALSHSSQLKKILEQSAKFSALKNVHFLIHVYHLFHHTLATKNHVLAPVFSKNPLKNEKTGRHTTPKKITRN